MYQVLINRGLLYFERKDYTNALYDFKMAAKLDPSDHRILHTLGLCYHKYGNKYIQYKFLLVSSSRCYLNISYHAKQRNFKMQILFMLVIVQGKDFKLSFVNRMMEKGFSGCKMSTSSLFINRKKFNFLHCKLSWILHQIIFWMDFQAYQDECQEKYCHTPSNCMHKA